MPTEEDGIHNFLKHRVMVTNHPNGKRVEGNYGDAMVWISRHARTSEAVHAVRNGIPIKMTDGSWVIFEKKI